MTQSLRADFLRETRDRSNVHMAGRPHVDVKRVSFRSAGEPIVGDLYVPVGFDRPRPALVVTGAWMTVKEQMPARYAREMASRGYVALAFDFRGWGESGGTRRQLEDPISKIADIKAAADYLVERPEVDPSRIGGLGVCASSGYMATAAADNDIIKAVALIAPWLHDRRILEETYGGAHSLTRLESAGAEAETKFRRTGRQVFVPAASTTDSKAIMFQAPYYTEPGRGLIPRWRNEADPAFWGGWLSFDAIRVAPSLKQPILLVHSEAAAIPQGAHRFYAGLTCRKRELWIDDVTQFDFYDRDTPVQTASNAADAEFQSTLRSSAR